MKRFLPLALVAAFVLGCQDVQQPVTSGSYAVSDGSDFGHHSGNPHFFFLPPLVPSPTYSGMFDASLLPYLSVEITGPFLSDASNATCGGPVAKAYTSANGLTVDPTTQQYAVGWKTGNDFPLQDGAVYRVCVRLKPTALVNLELGFRDTRASQGGGSVAEDPIYLFNAGSNIAIKFRVEKGVLDAALCKDNNGTVNYDCTAAVLTQQGDQAVCVGSTCSLTAGTFYPDQDPTLFLVERLDCTDFSDPTTGYSHYLQNIDIPQWGGCVKVTVFDPDWPGFLTPGAPGTVGACFYPGTGPALDLANQQDESLRLHQQVETTNPPTYALDRVPGAGGLESQCKTIFTGGLPPSDGAPMTTRLAWQLKQGWRTFQRVVDPWFAPPEAVAFHTGFGGSTDLDAGSGPGLSRANVDLPSGLSLSGAQIQGTPLVFRLAWALPSQMEKQTLGAGTSPTGLATEPLIVSVNQPVTVAVKVTDDGENDPPAECPTCLHWGPSRPVNGATVHYALSGAGTADLGTVGTLTDGIASKTWTPTLGGLYTLTASGMGIGPKPATGFGGFVPPTDGLIRLLLGSLSFQVFVCDQSTPGMTNAVVDGVITNGEYANADTYLGIPVSLGGSASSTANLYIGNDCQNLYVALEVGPGVDTAKAYTLRFVFDNTPPGGESADDDILSLSKSSVDGWRTGGLYRDRFLSQACIGSKQADCGPDDVPNGGLLNGAGRGAYNASSGKFVYEMRHPLKSADALHDFQRAFGQQVGFYLAVSLGTGSKGNTEWPDQKGGFKNYKLYTVKGPTLTP